MTFGNRTAAGGTAAECRAAPPPPCPCSLIFTFDYALLHDRALRGVGEKKAQQQLVSNVSAGRTQVSPQEVPG